jgi:anaerobic magnesium-protoporphyrin IX monomethyl ester cyclase
MKKVLIINEPAEMKECWAIDVYKIPLRVAYLAAILEKHGIDYDILDLSLEFVKEHGFKKSRRLVRSARTASTDISNLCRLNDYRDKTEYLSTLRKHLKKKRDFEYIALNSDSVYQVLNILREAKGINPGVKTILGGYAATYKPGLLLNPRYVDIIVRGYCDELLPNILNGRQYEALEIDGSNIMITPYGKIQEILTPSYEKIDLGSYLKIFNFMPVITHVGCIKSCNYCVSRINQQIVFREYGEIHDEIELFCAKHNVKNIYLQDQAFNISVGHMERMFNVLSKNRVSWISHFLPIPMDKKLIKKISMSGCFGANFGIENILPHLQKKLGKDVDIKEFEATLRSLKKHGIVVGSGLIYDIPGESLMDFYANLLFFLGKNIDYCNVFQLSYPTGSGFGCNPSEYFSNMVRDGYEVERIRPLKEVISLAIKKSSIKMLNPIIRKKRENRVYNKFVYKNT